MPKTRSRTYCDYEYYIGAFTGSDMTQIDFVPLARAATDLIDGIVTVPIPDKITDEIRRAAAYQIELLHQQGGVDAITGFAVNGGVSESLGGYSVGGGGASATQQHAPTVGGIPVSPVTIMLLRKAGHLQRWFKAGCENG